MFSMYTYILRNCFLSRELREVFLFLSYTDQNNMELLNKCIKRQLSYPYRRYLLKRTCLSFLQFHMQINKWREGTFSIPIRDMFRSKTKQQLLLTLQRVVSRSKNSYRNQRAKEKIAGFLADTPVENNKLIQVPGEMRPQFMWFLQNPTHSY